MKELDTSFLSNTIGESRSTGGHGATVARLIPDQKVGCSNHPVLKFFCKHIIMKHYLVTLSFEGLPLSFVLVSTMNTTTKESPY